MGERKGLRGCCDQQKARARNVVAPKGKITLKR